MGTEIINKASTAIQIAFEKDKAGKEQELIVVRCVKSRSSKRFEEFHLIYSDVEKGLILADGDLVNDFLESKKRRLNEDKIKEFLAKSLITPLPRKQLLHIMCKEFGFSERTHENTLKDFRERELMIITSGNEVRYLASKKVGKVLNYFLSDVPVVESTTTVED